MTAPQEPLKLTLGQRVRFKDTIRRRAVYEHPPGERSIRRKVWKRLGDSYPGASPKGGEGVLVGLRTFQDGRSPWIDDEVGYAFYPEQSHRVAMIATALHLKPVYAFLEDVEPLEEVL